MAKLELNCACGQVGLTLDVPKPGAATRVMCYCHDCQAAARHLGYALPAQGGTDILQSTPDRVTIRQGGDQLAALRLSPKGLVRWYASCCNTPVINTLPKPGLPFAGLVVHAAEADQTSAVVGPVWGRAFTNSAPPGQGAPTRDAHFKGTGLNIVSRMLGAVLSGRRKHNPLRRADGDWIVTPRILTLEERAAAYRQ